MKLREIAKDDGRRAHIVPADPKAELEAFAQEFVRYWPHGPSVNEYSAHGPDRFTCRVTHIEDGEHVSAGWTFVFAGGRIRRAFRKPAEGRLTPRVPA